MEGVNILNRIELMDYHPGWWLWVIIALAVVFAIAMCVLIPGDRISDTVNTIAFFTVVISFVSILVLLIWGNWAEPSGRYKYEATIDDTVSFTELYEKYEVVEQRGEIWVLKDKE